MKGVLTIELNKENCHWLSVTIPKETQVYEYHGCTYGCVQSSGVAVTLKENETPFFEVPKDAVRWLPEKVLFLDVDGVINSVRSAVAFGGYPWTADPKDIYLFDLVAVALIRKAVTETGAKIVLSSTWRKTMRFEDLGKALDLPIIDATPDFKQSHGRGKEIAAWLEKNPIDHYVIVDDDSDMTEEQKPFFVKTCSMNGMSWENFKQIAALLGHKEYQFV